MNNTEVRNAIIVNGELYILTPAKISAECRYCDLHAYCARTETAPCLSFVTPDNRFKNCHFKRADGKFVNKERCVLIPDTRGNE